MPNTNLKVIFDLPEDISTISIIDEILRDNGLAENAKEFLEKDDNGEEPRLIIVWDSTIVMAQKRIPEEKIIELLAKHLKTSQETARKIVSDIKEKLIPFAKIENQGGNFQEELLNKIRGNAPVIEPEKKLPVPNIKKRSIIDVDKNAEKIKLDRKPIVSNQQKPVIPTPTLPPKEEDKYKESIE